MRSRRGRLSGDSIVLNFHEFANELAKHKGAAKVQKLDDLLTEFSDHDLDDFDGRIALLETKHGATKNVYETKYHDVCQILNHKIRNGDHRWVTQTWNQSGDKEKNGKCVNSPDDLFLLPKNKSVITYGKKKKKYLVT